MCIVPGDAVAHADHRRQATKGVRTQRDRALTNRATQTRLLLSDMSEPSERLPQGVPAAYGWGSRPRLHDVAPFGNFRAFTAWGQLYQCAGVRPTVGTTVDLRALQTWVLPHNSTRWRRIQFSSDLNGTSFPDDYAGPTVAGRYWASSGGTSAQLVSGHNFHFWPGTGRASLDASHVAAVTVAVEARLGNVPTNAPTPCLVLSVGGDMWTSLTAPASNEDVGIGRFKRVQRHWRLFTMTTASADVLRQIPLPALSPAADDF